MGLRPDFWRPLEQYAEVEKGLKSTFFFIPFKDRPGEFPDGRTDTYRAARYDVGRFQEPIRSLTRQGFEAGLHGIDSWRDSRKGREEIEVIRRITGGNRIGVRMHWLAFSDATPKILEEAGVYYDSTLGYNEAVGYRSGTTQVFRLPGTSSVFELPLNVQDTAMFYTGRMNLSESRAMSMCGDLIEDMKTHGGFLTINWHDRSLSPERNWDAAYLALLGMLREGNTWFATAGEAIGWYEKRRAVRFGPHGASWGTPEAATGPGETGIGPPLALRVHTPTMGSCGNARSGGSFVDHPLIPGNGLASGCVR
jgi:peptidoglycan/xylan/chitin deacetylase (PgdA/CDA1 family)